MATIKINMESTESPYRKSTTKNSKNCPDKLELKMFDPVLRKHVLFKEKKIK